MNFGHDDFSRSLFAFVCESVQIKGMLGVKVDFGPGFPVGTSHYISSRLISVQLTNVLA
jgi:hypothetical protein